MKLSELIAYRDKLRKHDVNLFKSMNQQIFELMEAEIEDPQYLQKFLTHKDDIIRRADKFIAAHLDYDHELGRRIRQEEKAYFKESEDRFNANFEKESYDQKRQRVLEIEDNTKDYLIRRIERYATWDQPALQICPSHGNLTDTMVSFDPLYLMDFSQMDLQNVRKKYKPDYANRLRTYVFPPFKTTENPFNQLPQTQFGFVLAYNFFDNMPMNRMVIHLKQCFELLKTGGKMLFTFNDCDLHHNVDLLEKWKWKYYTPGKLVRHHLSNIGFTILKHFSESYGMAWFEVEKPGALESIKGGQTLATIERKLTAEQIKKAEFRKQKKQEAIEKTNLEMARRKRITDKCVPWRASNQGYYKDQLVIQNKKTYKALLDMPAEQRFIERNWKLVE